MPSIVECIEPKTCIKAVASCSIQPGEELGLYYENNRFQDPMFNSS